MFRDILYILYPFHVKPQCYDHPRNVVFLSCTIVGKSPQNQIFQLSDFNKAKFYIV